MKQADVQVWLGIRDVYESQGSAQGFKYIEAAQKIAEKYLALYDNPWTYEVYMSWLSKAMTQHDVKLPLRKQSM